MKRFVKLLFVFAMFFVLTGINADAQRRGQYLTSTGSNVNVRKGPGKSYSVITYLCWDVERMREIRLKLQLYRGERVKYLGQKKNGFLYVQLSREEEGGYMIYYKGWVSADFLR